MGFFSTLLKYGGKVAVWGVIKSVPKDLDYSKTWLVTEENLTKLTEVLSTRKISGQLPKLQKQQP